ncbi:hypothetical protein F4604DRAFT_1676500 [Suillus subluteus]|nr:hypothetical protein F4604DRAFT_1676500 [Suillus subluteus]
MAGNVKRLVNNRRHNKYLSLTKQNDANLEYAVVDEDEQWAARSDLQPLTSPDKAPIFSAFPFMMTTKSEAFDDRKRLSLVFSFLRKKQKRTIVLSCIRDMVSAPNLTPSSIAKIANACAATLPPSQFAHLLQEPNIEGHTALYWSIVNHGREVFSALAAFIPRFTPVCSSDLRQACIAISDHELFTQLKLEDVFNRHTPKKNEFVACFSIRMFQKRLRANPTQALGIEFIAGGHIWSLDFRMAKGKWRIAFSLPEDSLPACVESPVVVIQAPSGNTQLEDMRIPHPDKMAIMKPMVCVHFKSKHTDGFTTPSVTQIRHGIKKIHLDPLAF